MESVAGRYAGGLRWRLLSGFPDAIGRQYHLWIIAGMLATGVLLHYGDMVPPTSAVADRSPVGLVTRQSLERILFLLPVMYATLVFGARGGALVLAAAAGVLVPRVIIGVDNTDHAVPEIGGVMLVGGLLVLAITQQRREVEAQTRTRDSLRYFVRQVLTAQEDERKRIALELHDETAQALLLTCQRLDRLASGNGHALPPTVTSELDELRTATVQTLTDLRRLTQHLRPRILDDHGLVPALGWLADLLREQHGVDVEVHAEATLYALSPETQLLLFRIAQEALRNVGRHSGATRAMVSLTDHGGRLRMLVSDNGRGFWMHGSLSEWAQRGKLGLLGMHERARLLGGDVHVRSAPGRGTTVVVELPPA